RDDPDADAAACCADAGLAALRGLDGGGVELDSRPFEAVEDPCPHLRHVLAHAAAEGDAVAATEHSKIGAEVLPGAIAVELDRQARPLGALIEERLRIFVASGEAGQAGALIQHFEDLIATQAES